MEVTSELYNIRVDVTFGLENGGVEVHHLNWSIKEQYVQRLKLSKTLRGPPVHKGLSRSPVPYLQGKGSAF